MAATKKNTNLQVEEINKRRVCLADKTTYNELIAITDSSGMVWLSLDGNVEEEYMTEFKREDFLDLVVALFPDNVAYQFETE